MVQSSTHAVNVRLYIAGGFLFFKEELTNEKFLVRAPMCSTWALLAVVGYLKRCAGHFTCAVWHNCVHSL